MGEFNLARRVSLALAGSTTLDAEFPAHAVWAQFRVYVLGSTQHGLDLGLQAGYGWTEASLGPLSVFADGIAAGAFLGYKYVAPVGFTVDLQGGAQAVHRRAGVRLDDSLGGGSLSFWDELEWRPLMRANLGWSM